MEEKIKTQLSIDPTELKKQNADNIQLKGILNNNEIDLDYVLTINYINETDFTPKAALELHNNNSISVFNSTPSSYNGSKYLDLTTESFSLDFTFSLSQNTIINRPAEFPGTSGSLTNYYDDYRTIFFNTYGYLYIYTYGQQMGINIYDGTTKRELYLLTNSRKNTILTTYEDGPNYKYRLVINRDADAISATLYKSPKVLGIWGTETKIGGISTILINRKLGEIPLNYGNKNWHTTRIGHLPNENGFQKDYFFGWIHYFDLKIIEPPKDYRLIPMLQCNFEINPKNSIPKNLNINFTTEGKYTKNNLLDIIFTKEINEKYYNNKEILKNLSFEIGENHTNPVYLNIDFTVENLYANNNLLNINFTVKERPEDPGAKEILRKVIRLVTKTIGPFNDPTTEIMVPRTIINFPINLQLPTGTTREVIKEEEEPDPPDIGTLDDGDIIFEIVNKNVFFIEIDTETNTANLYKKETLESQSYLLASLNQINGDAFNFKDTWTHIALTYDLNTDTLVLFINGKKAYMTTDVKNLDWGYMQFNTFNTQSSSTYFTGITVTDNIDFVDTFPIRSGPIAKPFSPYVSRIHIPRKIKILPILSKPGIIYTGYRIPYRRQLIFIRTLNLPVIIIAKRRIFVSARFHVWAYAIQTYVHPPGHVGWKGHRIFGPLTSNTKLYSGAIYLYPRRRYIPKSGRLPRISRIRRRYYPVRRYAESWTLSFWYFRCCSGSQPHIDILHIKNHYGTFIFSTEYFTTIFKGKTIRISSIPYIKLHKWIHIAISYNVKTSMLYIYINNILVYSIYIRLASPYEIIFFVGIYLTNCNFFTEIKMINKPKDGNKEPDPVPENPETSEFSSPLKRIVEVNKPKFVVFLEGGLDEFVIDYRLFMYYTTTINTANKNEDYEFDVSYICSQTHNDKIVPIGPDPNNKWMEVRCLGPDKHGSLGYIHYKAISTKKLSEYTIDFWVYKENNYSEEDSLDYPLIDITGSSDKIRVVMTDKTIEYYSYIDNEWISEMLINSKTTELTNKWNHVAVTFDLPSKNLSVFINGEKYVESSTYSSLPLEEINIYTNTQNKSTQYLTSIRISSINRFKDDEYNMDEVNHPYGKILDTNTLILRPTKYQQDILNINYNIDPQDYSNNLNIEFEVTDIEPEDYDTKLLNINYNIDPQDYSNNFNIEFEVENDYIKDILNINYNIDPQDYSNNLDIEFEVENDYTKDILNINYNIEPQDYSSNLDIEFVCQGDYTKDILNINYNIDPQDYSSNLDIEFVCQRDHNQDILNIFYMAEYSVERPDTSGSRPFNNRPSGKSFAIANTAFIFKK